MRVSLATEEDLEPIRAIENRAILETTANFNTDPLALADVREQFEAESAQYPWLVAGEVDQVLGFARGCRHKGRCAYRFAVETTVYVVPSHHRRGVGRALYGALLPLLRSQGFHTALGIIALPNQGSVALHEAFGFRQVGTIHQAGWKFDAWHDVGTWELFLSPPGTTPAGLQPVAAIGLAG
jgi:phosphinothricin acetyltransferase